MVNFRDREKARQTVLKQNRALFSGEAQGDGSYGGNRYSFCLGGSVPGENLYSGIRGPAIEYFKQRKIDWHGGEQREVPCDLPSRHLCCSQSMCVNSLFPLREEPDLLVNVLTRLDYPVLEPLPFNPDGDCFNEPGYVAFEWIGLRNYLNERSRGRIASDLGRTRGVGFTSADFAIRFKRTDGQVQIVLGEWKYTECYGDRSIQRSKSGTNRLNIYKDSLTAPDCPVKWANVGVESLFFEPFDQMMRMQLLARAMERAGELSATIVSVLHVAPSANRELMLGVASPLKPIGRDIHEVWTALVHRERFKGVDTQRVVGLLTEHTVRREWADYMRIRYGAME